ncbi:hypothetical protein [Microbulbifer epialgicus]|uniref:Uncharacterized protein n=1 Tax=Microbulbifer epialgicus TaxID=393907 RepID=A0ABV4P1Z2_9GAMM
MSNKAIGLQFDLTYPAVAAVIPDASKPSRIKEEMEALETDIPEALWQKNHVKNTLSPIPLPFRP